MLHCFVHSLTLQRCRCFQLLVIIVPLTCDIKCFRSRCVQLLLLRNPERSLTPSLFVDSMSIFCLGKEDWIA
ncbi:hypothetical protein BDQ12DRAFT_688928 [Crucibulum laeve]|uniref:Secreted protein n=1 Tax=Crucibulum laeve TaxID=68775 RepID=A0A5C3LS16_9AGAR|nr:hypothetical protein BDQ12DRAFT_688928 [Crucibulum laeve]